MESFSLGCVTARLTELKLFQDYTWHVQAGNARSAEILLVIMWKVYGSIQNDDLERLLQNHAVYTLAISPAPAAIFCR